MLVLPNEPDEIPQRIAETWSYGDAEAFASLFTEDADFINVVGIWWRDRKAIQRAHAYGFERTLSQVKLHIQRTEVRMLSAEYAVVHAQWRLSGQRTVEGDVSDPRSGIFMLVTERQPQGWIVVAAQNTEILSGAEMNVRTDCSSGVVSYQHN